MNGPIPARTGNMTHLIHEWTDPSEDRQYRRLVELLRTESYERLQKCAFTTRHTIKNMDRVKDCTPVLSDMSVIKLAYNLS